MLSHCSISVSFSFFKLTKKNLNDFLPFAKTYMQIKFLTQSWLWYCESLSVQTNNSIKVNAAGKLCVCGCPHSAPAHTSDAVSPDWSLMWVAHSACESLEPVSGLLSWLPGVITRAQEFAGRIVSKQENVQRESLLTAPTFCSSAVWSVSYDTDEQELPVSFNSALGDPCPSMCLHLKPDARAGSSTCPEAESKAADTPQVSGLFGLLRILPSSVQLSSYCRSLSVRTINAPTNTNLGLRNQSAQNLEQLVLLWPSLVRNAPEENQKRGFLCMYLPEFTLPAIISASSCAPPWSCYVSHLFLYSEHRSRNFPETDGEWRRPDLISTTLLLSTWPSPLDVYEHQAKYHKLLTHRIT